MQKLLSKIDTSELKQLLDGLIYKNTILISGLVIAPAVVAANTYSNALLLVIAFSVITFITIMTASFIPKNIVYTIRIIIYTVIGAMVYLPTIILLEQIMPNSLGEVGIYVPLLVANSLIVVKAETRFFKRSKGYMMLDVISYIMGFNIVILLIGIFRDLFANSMLMGHSVNVSIQIPALAAPFGGFILLGLFAALYRYILNKLKE